MDHQELNKQLRVFLRTYTGIIDSVINEVQKQEDDEIVRDVLVMLMQSVGSSCFTLFKITDAAELTIKDAYIVMRSVVETTINLCLILSDSSYAEKAHMHALQRTARFMNREQKIGSWNFKTQSSAYKEFGAREDVQDAIAKYKEREPWTNENSIQKLEIIEQNMGACVALHGAYYSIYSEAAELMHGSYYGIINFYGFNKQQDIHEKFLSIQTEILFHAISCLNSLIEFSGKKYSLDRAMELSNELFESVLEKSKEVIESKA